MDTLNKGGDTAKTLDIRELDMLVAEAAIICQNCMSLSLDRCDSPSADSETSDGLPMTTMNTMPLFKAVFELLAAYRKLEQAYLVLGIDKVGVGHDHRHHPDSWNM